MSPTARLFIFSAIFLMGTGVPGAAQSAGPALPENNLPETKTKRIERSDAVETGRAKTTETRDAASVQPTQLSAAPSPAPAAEPGRTYFELLYTVDGTQIQGNRDRSFLNEGINHTAQASFFFNQPVRESWRFEHLVVGRYTDNPRVDPERSSLQRLYFRLSGPSFEANLGDALVNYSRLTFNQNIKGLHLWKDWTRRLRLTGTAGVFADRWGTIYRDYSAFRDIRLDCQAQSLPGAPAPGCVEYPAGSGQFILSPENPSKPYTRLVAGSRLEYKIGRGGWLAANWSHGKDLLQTLPEANTICEDNNTAVRTVRKLPVGCLANETELPGYRQPTTEAFRNSVVSGDGQYEIQPWKLRLRGEFAYSWSAGGIPPAGVTATNFVCATQPPVVGASVLDYRCFGGVAEDFAARGEASQRIGKLNWRVDYTRFQPDFLSVNARQIRDLQEISVRGEYELIRQVTVAASWRRSNDNLNGERNYTNVIRAPEARLILRALPFYRMLSVEVGYRERNLETQGSPLATERRKRSMRIPFLLVAAPVGASHFSFEYEHRHDIDSVVQQQSSDTGRFAIGFRGNYTWGEWDFSPFVRLEVERLAKNLPRNAELSPTDASLAYPQDFFDGYDTNRSLQAGFLLEAPRYLRLEAQYREFNSLTLSSLRASAALDPLLRSFYLNQGFKRPNWRAAATWKLFNDENRTLTIFYERNNNFFDTGDPFVPDLKSFRETVIGGSILLRFDR